MKTFEYTVTVTAETQEEADQVMAERIYFEEDYGFEYQIDFERDERTPREQMEDEMEEGIAREVYQ